MRRLIVFVIAALSMSQAALRRTDPLSTDLGQVVRGVDNAAAAYGRSAFGAQRTAAPYTLADIVNTYNIDPEIWGTYVDGGATITHLTNESSILLSAPSDGGIAILQTHSNYRYQAGKGALVLQTVVPSAAPPPGVTYRWGYFDVLGGLYWRARFDAGVEFVRRSSIDGGVSETAWRTDAGLNVFGVGSIFEQRFQWLGVGTVEAFINGRSVAKIEHAGTLPYVYINSATLPVRYEAENLGPVGTVASMKQICASVQSEGGTAPPAFGFSARRTADLTVGGNATDVPVISVRPKQTFKGLPNKGALLPIRGWCLSDSKRIRADIHLRPNTLLGASFVSVNSESLAEYDEGATAYDGGTHIASFAVSANSQNEVDLGGVLGQFGELRRRLTTRAFGVVDGGAAYQTGLDTLVLEVSNPAAGNATVNCSIDWVEVR